jgi:hypothetical protein
LLLRLPFLLVIPKGDLLLLFLRRHSERSEGSLYLSLSCSLSPITRRVILSEMVRAQRIMQSMDPAVAVALPAFFEAGYQDPPNQ